MDSDVSFISSYAIFEPFGDVARHPKAMHKQTCAKNMKAKVTLKKIKSKKALGTIDRGLIGDQFERFLDLLNGLRRKATFSRHFPDGAASLQPLHGLRVLGQQFLVGHPGS